MLAEVQNAEKLLKRRLPIGSQISEKHVVDDFVKQVKTSFLFFFFYSLIYLITIAQKGITEFAIRKAIAILIQRDELEYRNQRKRIYRRC